MWHCNINKTRKSEALTGGDSPGDDLLAHPLPVPVGSALDEPQQAYDLLQVAAAAPVTRNIRNRYLNKPSRHPTSRIERRNIPERVAAWEGRRRGPRRYLTRPPSLSESESPSPSEPESSESRGRLAGLRVSPAGGTRPPPPRGVVAGGIAGGREEGGSEKPERRWGGGNFKFRNSRAVGPP